METMIVVGILSGAIMTFIILGLTSLRSFRIAIVLITSLLIYFGLNNTIVQYEPTILGSSDIIVGKIGKCANALSKEECYQKVEYRGFPLKAIRTTFKEKDGAVTKHTIFSSAFINAGNSNGGGFILNYVIVGTIVSLMFYFISKLYSRNKNL